MTTDWASREIVEKVDTYRDGGHLFGIAKQIVNCLKYENGVVKIGVMIEGRFAKNLWKDW